MIIRDAWRVVLALAAWAVCGRGAEPALPGAFVVGPYLQRAGQTEMTIRWIAPAPGAYAVRFGTGEKLAQEAAPAEPRPVSWQERASTNAPAGSTPAVRTNYLYAARLTNLTAGTTYRYEVGLGSDRAGAVFRTSPAAAEKFTFIAYGDNRSAPEIHRKVAAGFLQHQPAFIINSGDLVSSGAYREWKPEFFEPLAATISRVPLWPTIGNHDGDYRKYFSLPNRGLWYSFDYANVHVTCLLSTAGPSKVEEMREWCAADLAASKATWKFVFYHHPSYDNGKHVTAWGRKDFLPIFRKHGVDFVIAGHSHSYQRFSPMYTKGENEKRPITHIIAAGGGASIRGTMIQDPYLVSWATEHNYTVFEVDGDRLSARTLAPGGRELDAFTVTKANGVPDAAWLAAAVPEEEFGELRGRVVPFMRGLAFEADPRPGKPVAVKFKLGAGASAMRYELRLAKDDDSRDFTMKGVSGSVKAGATVDIEVALQLRKPGAFADPKVAMSVPRLECLFEIDGRKASVYSNGLRFRQPEPKADEEHED